MCDFIETNSQGHTLVRSPEAEKLRALLEARGADVHLVAKGGRRVDGPDATAIGDMARGHGLAIHELTPAFSSLEEVCTAMSQSSVEYQAREAQAASAGPQPVVCWGGGASEHKPCSSDLSDEQ